jgi:hypothetical protein
MVPGGSAGAQAAAAYHGVNLRGPGTFEPADGDKLGYKILMSRDPLFRDYVTLSSRISNFCSCQTMHILKNRKLL